MFKKEYVGWVALIIALIALVVSFKSPVVSLSGSTDDFFDAKGGFKVNGTVVVDSSGNVDGAVTSGAASTFASTLGVTGTTTIGQTLILNESPICISAYATSSATRVNLTFDATAATSTSLGAFKWAYGTCN